MKKEKLPSLISVLILTLVTTVMWVSLNVYRSFSDEPEPSVPKEISEPVMPSLDVKVMDELKTKIFLDESQIPNVKINQIEEVQNPIATDEAEIQE